ncbi:hypothetical protein QJ48_04030 [Paenibacillus sp. A3]|uniref:Ig-like domain-containing protein n=1 Tax=Paenibacillus sp. A3 TaxID=1337054 RepID=UPI0006D57A99|nr:Ig-like domain-containing protein [Paenibacillus sp. A3]KPV60711.1 hypothetical protein QJ48_04030 [Paenibacillus sp. A3]
MQRYYAHVNEQGKVYGVSMNPSIMVPLPVYDSNYMNTFYDEKTGQFIGIRITLSADKTEISADGTDTATVTASFKNWDGTPAEYTKDLVVSVDGVRTVLKKEKGTYKMKLSSAVEGIKTISIITSEDPHLMDSQPVKVNFVAPSK